MCTPEPSPLFDIGAYWTDEELILFLDRIQHGLPLPRNVLVDANPFEHKPSSLPDDIWYFVHSDTKKETDIGLWKASGGISQIYDDSKLTGWRSTLEFNEGLWDDRHITDWVMQKYWITLKGTNSLKVNRRPEDTNSSDLDQNLDDLDCFSRGDYLELRDLLHPRSSTSSSDNCSCVSVVSDEIFDYLALLNDLEPDNNKQIQSDSTSYHLSVPMPSIPKDVVSSVTRGSLVTQNEGQLPGQPLKLPDPVVEGLSNDKTSTVQTGASTNHRSMSDKGKRHDDEKDRQDTVQDSSGAVLKSQDTFFSQRSVTDKGEKIALGKMKILKKKYLCFIPF